MKKNSLIIIGIVAIVVLFAIWLYLLIYGTPKKVTDVFTNFGFFNSSAVTPVIDNTPVIATTTPTVDVAPAKLRQLTTRPVVGFREFTASSTEATSTPSRFMNYVEAGTGHVYSINLISGEETRLSNTTIPNAESAEFSSDEKFVAIRSGYGNNSRIILLTLNNTGSGVADTLTQNMLDFSFSTGDELFYSGLTNFGISGYALRPNTKIVRTLFNVPFQSATIIWSKDNITPIYVYPKATASLNGYLYQIQTGIVSRLQIEGKGLTAEGKGDYVFFTSLYGSENSSIVYNKKSKQFISMPVVMDPNKCTFSNRVPSLVYCGYQLTSYGSEFPDNWYMGTKSFSDNIWSVNLESQSASQLIIPEKVVGRQIDITDIINSPDGRMLYFRNKNDNTLWMYEI